MVAAPDGLKSCDHAEATFVSVSACVCPETVTKRFVYVVGAVHDPPLPVDEVPPEPPLTLPPEPPLTLPPEPPRPAAPPLPPRPAAPAVPAPPPRPPLPL